MGILGTVAAVESEIKNKVMELIETKRMWLREATADDIDQIIALEEHKDNPGISSGSALARSTRTREHDPNDILPQIREKNKTGALWAMHSIRLNPRSEIFELRRIAISEKNRGYGREAMVALFKFAFEELNINRFWLDAYAGQYGRDTPLRKPRHAPETEFCARTTSQNGDILTRLFFPC